MMLSVKANDTVFLVDFDDTLIEAQPDPTNFEIPEDLRFTVQDLSQKPWLRLIIVTGRSVAQIDQFFHPVRFPIIGCHGCEARFDTEDASKDIHPVIPEALHAQIMSIVQHYPNCRIEDKRYTFAIHACAEDQPLLRGDLDKAIGNHRETYSLALYGSCFEIKPSSISKGKTIAKILQEEPRFSGLKPVYIGDDVGIDASLNILLEFGGALISVGNAFSEHGFGLKNPLEVRDFLRSIT